MSEEMLVAVSLIFFVGFLGGIAYDIWAFFIFATNSVIIGTLLAVIVVFGGIGVMGAGIAEFTGMD